MTYASQLWYLNARDRSLTTEIEQIRLALAKEPNLVQVAVTPDPATGGVWVAFFARSEGGTTGARIGQRAIVGLTELPRFAGAEAKPEWGGAIYPEPDPGRPETFPPLPTIEAVTAMRRRRTSPRSDPGAQWYRVTAQVHGIDQSLVIRTATAMETQIRRMQRVDQPDVRVSKDGSAVDLTFLIAGVGADGAAREGFHLVDALVTMTVDDQQNCRIEVQNVLEPTTMARNTT
jgi:hypothetical protein